MILRKIRLSAAVVALAGSMLMPNPVKADNKNKNVSKYDNKVVADVRTNLNIRKKATTDSIIIGKMKRGNQGTILEKKNQWTKIKSGSVIGYVKNDYLVFEQDIEDFAKENVKKKAEVKAESLRVREKASTESDVKTLVSEGSSYTVKDQNNQWAKVKVQGGTGYVSKDYVEVKYAFGKAKSVEEIQAEEQEKNNTSTNSSSSAKTESMTEGNQSGSQMVSYAKQFVGNKYVYGGNSLTNGIDCSGFTQQIMAKYGYSISRTSSSQATEGVAVSTNNLQPGDLLFYGSGSGINHVAMYIGDGQIVHASNSAPYPRGGIKISNAFYRTPVCARRIIG